MTKREIETLFKTHYTRMYRLAASILYDEDESKEVTYRKGEQPNHRRHPQADVQGLRHQALARPRHHQ